MATDHDPEFEALLTFLKESRGFDFTGYKRSSLMRRVDRRLQQVEPTSYSDYIDYLQLHPNEFTALFNTILINVTAFFRDGDVWNQFRDSVLPEVIAAGKPTDPIRCWSAGCASGEEAYSLAIMLAELLGPDEFRERVKIYATDIDDEALMEARHASYGERDVRDVPPDLLEKYFERQGDLFNFRSDLRRSVIFGRNDLVQDAPISRVDVLLCRNTLMYFNAETQARILNRFYFALAEAGVLMLGKAELLLSQGHLFAPIDLKRRFFRKVLRPNAVVGGMAPPPNQHGPQRVPADELPTLRVDALNASPVATVILTSGGVLAHTNQRAEGLFSLSPRDVGRPFRDLEMSYRPVELRGYIDEAVQQRRPTWLREVEWLRGGSEATYLDFQLVPLVGTDDSNVGVAIYVTDVTRYRKLQTELEYSNRHLETAYEELQSTVEELETTNEELQSTVEELETTNEELQSTNEELETMNEELQSTNDELQTINDELRDRTQDLNEANSFVDGILAGLPSGVVVVDPDMKIRAWNHRAEDQWGMRSDEVVGKNLLALDIGLPTQSLRPLVRSVVVAGDETSDTTVDAVNRVGRSVTVRVVCSPLRLRGEPSTGAILVIDEV